MAFMLACVPLDLVNECSRYTLEDVLKRPLRASLDVGVPFFDIFSKYKDQDEGTEKWQKIVMKQLNQNFLSIKDKAKKHKFSNVYWGPPICDVLDDLLKKEDCPSDLKFFQNHVIDLSEAKTREENAHGYKKKRNHPVLTTSCPACQCDWSKFNKKFFPMKRCLECGKRNPNVDNDEIALERRLKRSKCQSKSCPSCDYDWTELLKLELPPKDCSSCVALFLGTAHKKQNEPDRMKRSRDKEKKKQDVLQRLPKQNDAKWVRFRKMMKMDNNHLKAFFVMCGDKKLLEPIEIVAAKVAAMEFDAKTVSYPAVLKELFGEEDTSELILFVANLWNSSESNFQLVASPIEDIRKPPKNETVFATKIRLVKEIKHIDQKSGRNDLDKNALWQLSFDSIINIF